MSDKGRLFDHINQLAICARSSVSCVRKQRSTTYASWLATNHYIHATHQLGSICDLATVSDERLLGSVHGIASLARDIIETHDAFVYLFIESVPKVVREFRISLYHYHSVVEVDSIAGKVGCNTVPSQQAWIIDLCESDLVANLYFQGLPIKVRNRLLKGKSAFYWRDSKRKYPSTWSKDRRDGVYALLSNSVHATANGISASIGLLPDRLLATVPTFRFSIVSSLQYFSNLAFLFFNRRHHLKDRMAKDFQQLIANLLRQDLFAQVIPTRSGV